MEEARKRGNPVPNWLLSYEWNPKYEFWQSPEGQDAHHVLSKALEAAGETVKPVILALEEKWAARIKGGRVN